jgi:hypothetical protein
MRYRSLITVALTVSVLFVAPAVTARAGACPAAGQPPTAPATTDFFDNNKNLGPKILPTDGPVAKLLPAYKRFGAFGSDGDKNVEADWTRTFIDPAADPNKPWKWPPISAGFDTKAGPPLGTPNEKNRKLTVGQQLDRFGDPDGRYLSPRGAIPIPFGLRALPPSSLNTPAGAPQSNYHVYCVVQEFAVDAGPIYGWFAQPGNGVQYFLNADYLPGKPWLNVQWLIDNKRLIEVAPQ